MPRKSLFSQTQGLNIHRGNLVENVPTPGSGMGHRLSYMPSTKIGALGPGDDWKLLEDLEQFGGPGAEPILIEKSCIACGIAHQMIAKQALLRHAKEMKWLCGECRDDGYIWAFDLMAHDMIQYQVVKQFPDDTLMRRLDRSPNYKEAVHKPVDAVETQAKYLKRKSKKRRIF